MRCEICASWAAVETTYCCLCNSYQRVGTKLGRIRGHQARKVRKFEEMLLKIVQVSSHMQWSTVHKSPISPKMLLSLQKSKTTRLLKTYKFRQLDVTKTTDWKKTSNAMLIGCALYLQHEALITGILYSFSGALACKSFMNKFDSLILIIKNDSEPKIGYIFLPMLGAY